MLGRQLAEFEEDQDRLDVLALDDSGEIVLTELKVTDSFRVTDLQALAYAGAYATRPTHELAETLRRTLSRTAESEPTAAVAPAQQVNQAGAAPPVTSVSVSLDDAKALIQKFLGLDEFDDWQPSQHVRIKLLAPKFPRRVLKTVKWLGDVYDMPIEAIAVRLFEDAKQQYSLSFERILPLPGAEEFDLTVRRREDRRRSENAARARQPDILPLLVDNDVLKDGQKLWLAKKALPVGSRDSFDADNTAYQVRVVASDGSPPRFEWRASDSDAAEVVSPSDVVYRIFSEVLGVNRKPFKTGVAGRFTVAPGGKTLEDLALDKELWSPVDDTEVE